MVRFRKSSLARVKRQFTLAVHQLKWENRPDSYSSFKAYVARNGAIHLIEMSKLDQAQKALGNPNYLASFLALSESYLTPLTCWRVLSMNALRTTLQKQATLHNFQLFSA